MFTLRKRRSAPQRFQVELTECPDFYAGSADSPYHCVFVPADRVHVFDEVHGRCCCCCCADDDMRYALASQGLRLLFLFIAALLWILAVSIGFLVYTRQDTKIIKTSQLSYKCVPPRPARPAWCP